MNTTQELPSENEPKTLYEKVCQERDEYRKALEQIAEHDGEILFPGSGFFSSVSVASETLAKYPQQ